jgi:hypothetical protein
LSRRPRSVARSTRSAGARATIENKTSSVDISAGSDYWKHLTLDVDRH